MAACGNLPIQAEIKARFEAFKDLASKTYALMKMIKSQDKLNPDEFDRTLLHFILAWEKTCPNVACFNKLHFLIEHYSDFTQRYHMYGRKSAESHESVHTLISRIKEAVKRMTLTEKMFNTIFACSMADLKPGVAKKRRKLQRREELARSEVNIRQVEVQDGRTQRSLVLLSSEILFKWKAKLKDLSSSPGWRVVSRPSSKKSIYL